MKYSVALHSFVFKMAAPLLLAAVHALHRAPLPPLHSLPSPSPPLRTPSPPLLSQQSIEKAWEQRESTLTNGLRAIDGTLLSRAVRVTSHVPALATLSYFGLVAVTQMMPSKSDLISVVSFKQVITRAVGPTSNAQFSQLFSTLVTCEPPRIPCILLSAHAMRLSAYVPDRIAHDITRTPKRTSLATSRRTQRYLARMLYQKHARAHPHRKVTHSLIHSRTHPRSHPLTHSLTHSSTLNDFLTHVRALTG